MIDELTEVGIQGRNAALFGIWAIKWLFEPSRHSVSQRRKVYYVFIVVFSECRPAQRAKHTSESSLKGRRTPSGHQPAHRRTVSRTHFRSSYRKRIFSLLQLGG